MSKTVVGDVVVLVLVSAAAFSTGWVLRDATARGMPRRKVLTWAVLQWVEFPLFLWLYRRIRPKRRREAPDVGTGSQPPEHQPRLPSAGAQAAKLEHRHERSARRDPL